MKRKDTTLLGLLVAALIVFCASSLLAKVGLSGADGSKMEILYSSASTDGNYLFITASYTGPDDFFEIGKDLVVSTNKDMSEPLKLKLCTANEKTLTYQYELMDGIEQVYIEPPVLYCPREIDSVKVALNEQEICFQGNNPWFTIQTVDIQENEGSNTSVSVTVDFITSSIPRLPKLVIDGQSYYCISEINYNADGTISDGVFLYNLPKEINRDRLDKDSAIEISSMLITISPENLDLSANIKNLVVIEK